MSDSSLCAPRWSPHISICPPPPCWAPKAWPHPPQLFLTAGSTGLLPPRNPSPGLGSSITSQTQAQAYYHALTLCPLAPGAAGSSKPSLPPSSSLHCALVALSSDTHSGYAVCRRWDPNALASLAGRCAGLSAWQDGIDRNKTKTFLRLGD